MLNELSANVITFSKSNVPVRHETILFFGPAPLQVGESRVVDDGRDGVIHLPPELVEWGVLLPFQAADAVLAAFKEAVDLADGDLGRGPRQQVSAFGAPPRFHKSTLLQTGQDQLQK